MSFSCLPLKPGDHLIKERIGIVDGEQQTVYCHAIFCGQFSLYDRESDKKHVGVDGSGNGDGVDGIADKTAKLAISSPVGSDSSLLSNIGGGASLGALAGGGAGAYNAANPGKIRDFITNLKPGEEEQNA